MADLGQIQRALATRLPATLDDYTVYAFAPDAVNVPCIFFRPDSSMFIDYEQTYDEGFAKWRFLAVILTNRQDEESAQELLSDALDPLGPIVSSLRDDANAEDGMAVWVLNATNFGGYAVGGTSYFGVVLRLTVMA